MSYKSIEQIKVGLAKGKDLFNVPEFYRHPIVCAFSERSGWVQGNVGGMPVDFAPLMTVLMGPKAKVALVHLCEVFDAIEAAGHKVDAYIALDVAVGLRSCTDYQCEVAILKAHGIEPPEGEEPEGQQPEGDPPVGDQECKSCGLPLNSDGNCYHEGAPFMPTSDQDNVEFGDEELMKRELTKMTSAEAEGKLCEVGEYYPAQSGDEPCRRPAAYVDRSAEQDRDAWEPRYYCEDCAGDSL